jgi:hypothetical protein
MSRSVSHRVFMALALSLWVCSGCGPSQMGPKPEAAIPQAGHDDHGHDHGHDHAHGGAGDMHEGHDHHVHGQEGPHKGAIVVVAGHKLHLEFVLNAEDGKLTAYVLDSELKEGATLKQEEVIIGFLAKAAEGAAGELKEPEEVKLAAVNAKDGAAGEFAGQSDKLKGLTEFDGQVMSVTFNDKKYEGVKFEYPKGNEHLEH